MSLSVNLRRIDAEKYIAYVVLDGEEWKPLWASIGYSATILVYDAFKIVDSIKDGNMIYG